MTKALFVIALFVLFASLSFAGSCGGLAKACSAFSTQPQCVTQSGCSWTTSCVGIHASCTTANYPDSTACNGNLTCRWTVNNPPYFPAVGVNNTSPLPAESVMHNATIADDVGLSGYVFSWTGGTNCVTWANNSWVSFTANNTNASIIKTVPSACEGRLVQWRVYANDSNGAWAVTQTQGWEQNSSINASLPGGIFFEFFSFAPSVFQMGTQWFMISGDSSGNFFGFDWTGTQWEQNNTINASLPDLGHDSGPSVFQMGTQWFLISGEYDGGFFGFDWNGTSWRQNATINASLPDIGVWSAPNVFHMDKWYLIAGAEEGGFFGFSWNGTSWKQNSSINASLPDLDGTETSLGYSAPSVFQMGSQWFLITGESNGGFLGFDWTGTQWEQNSTINASLPNTYMGISKPSVFQMGSQWFMIAGGWLGTFYGFDRIGTSKYSVQNVNPVISEVHVNTTSANVNSQVCVNATVTDAGAGVNSSRVIAIVEFPNSTISFISLTNSSVKGTCGGGGSIYSAVFGVGGVAGSLILANVHAYDLMGNLGSTDGLLLKVTINAAGSGIPKWVSVSQNIGAGPLLLAWLKAPEYTNVFLSLKAPNQQFYSNVAMGTLTSFLFQGMLIETQPAGNYLIRICSDKDYPNPPVDTSLCSDPITVTRVLPTDLQAPDANHKFAWTFDSSTAKAPYKFIAKVCYQKQNCASPAYLQLSSGLSWSQPNEYTLPAKIWNALAPGAYWYSLAVTSTDLNLALPSDLIKAKSLAYSIPRAFTK